MSIMCEECKCSIDRETQACDNGCLCCNGERITYYTTCETCEIETGTATVLQGTGLYDREGNVLYGDDCTGCGAEVAIQNWLDDEEYLLENGDK